MARRIESPIFGFIDKLVPFRNIFVRIVRNARRRHEVDKLLVVDPFFGYDGAHHFLVGDVIDVILVGEVVVDSV